MKPPKCYEGLFALVFLTLGGVFSLLGLVGEALSMPTRGGEPLSFLLGGLPMLLFGIGLLWSARRKELRWSRLRSEGQAVPGQVAPGSIRCRWYTSWGSDGFRKRNPWSLVCLYRWEGRSYSVTSQLLWERPCEEGQAPTIYLDPRNPRQAWVDPESLKYEVSLG